MRRGPKLADSAEPEVELVKSTYKLPKPLKRNLQVLALLDGRDQADLVRDAIDTYLRARDVDPTREPNLITHRLPERSARGSNI